MIDSSRRLLTLLVLVFLLAACAPAGTTIVNPKNTNHKTAATQVTHAPTSTSASVADDTCPAEIATMPGCYTPRALRVAYGVQSLIDKGFTGKGQTVVDIVSFGSPTIQRDTDVFSQKFGLPSTTVQVISPLNKPEYDPYGDKSGWASETTLDVQIIHAIAPDAKIVVLVSPVAETEGTIGLPEFRQLEQYVIDRKLGNIVSQSWGASELTLQDAKGRQELKQWDTLLQNGTTKQGITYLTSSGDHGATDYMDMQSKQLGRVPTTGFAADSPWVTSVGGTTLVRNGSTFSERVWNNNTDSGSGGGFSQFYQTPSYQRNLPTSVQQIMKNRRGVPDVAAAADPYTGLAFYQTGSWYVAGGTSASAPVWAGIVAIANQMAGRPLGFMNPALYKLAGSSTYTQDFHDITVGDNSNRSAGVKGYPAVRGWDPDTGLGTPNAEKLLPDLIATMKS